MVGFQCNLTYFLESVLCFLCQIVIGTQAAGMKQIRPLQDVLKKAAQAPQNTRIPTAASMCCGYQLAVKLHSEVVPLLFENGLCDSGTLKDLGIPERIILVEDS